MSLQDQKYEARDVRVASPFSEWLDNFWFHHKGKVIVSLIALFMAIVVIVQMVTVVPKDIMVMYSGRVYLSGSTMDDIQNIFSKVLSDAVREDNKIVGLTQYHVYSKTQIESLRAETDADGVSLYVDSALNSKNFENYNAYIMTGQCAVLLLEPWLYEELQRNDRLRPMKELFSSLPASVDEKGYGIHFGETELYRYYNVMREIPEDTIMCMLKPYVFGETSNEIAYAQMQTLFCAIVNYVPSES